MSFLGRGNQAAFSGPKQADVSEATVRELKKLFPDTTAIKGKIVGLTCPSRDIRDIAQVLITAVSFLKPGRPV